ncbi:DUF6893 family small protein [Streptomyces sp. NPDC060334]
MKKEVLCGVALAALFTVAVLVAPDIKRYLRMRRM